MLSRRCSPNQGDPATSPITSTPKYTLIYLFTYLLIYSHFLPRTLTRPPPRVKTSSAERCATKAQGLLAKNEGSTCLPIKLILWSFVALMSRVIFNGHVRPNRGPFRANIIVNKRESCSTTKACIQPMPPPQHASNQCHHHSMHPTNASTRACIQPMPPPKHASNQCHHQSMHPTNLSTRACI